MVGINIIGHFDGKLNCSGNIIDSNGISPTLCAGMGEGGGIVPMIVSMRGRDVEHPTSRKKSNNFKQRLEIQQNGELCGTLTTYQKDNMVLEPITTDGQRREIANTILAGYERTNMTGFNNDNAVLVGGLGEMKSNNGTQYYQQDRVYDSNGLAMAHPAQIPEGSYKYLVTEKKKHQQDNLMSEDGLCITQCAGLSGRYNVMVNEKTHQQDLVQSDEGVSRTLVAGSHGNADNYTKTITNYRIRKLTPKECFRLMGVKDEDFEKLTVSNSQLYKQAGNSIVVDVLEAIFENMFINECKSNSLF